MRELSLHILDIAQNSITARAPEITITLVEDRGSNALDITLTDNGKGMTPEQLQQVADPFFTTRTTRKVGMGVSLFRMAAEQTGGSFSIHSAIGQGTTVTARFCTNHLDCIPLGDMASTLVTLLTMNEGTRFLYGHMVDGNAFRFDSVELQQALEGVPFNEPEVANWLQEYFTENLQSLYEA